jgi:hypothetical protein
VKKECAMKLKKLIWSWAIGMLVCRMRMDPLSMETGDTQATIKIERREM